MSKQNQYFRLGVFILSGIGLLVAGIVILGAGALFEDVVYGETYFNESVQGLDVGAPVKYRGVEIGRVSSIGFVSSRYPESAYTPAARYVLVQMKFKRDQAKNFLQQKSIDEVTEAGLRIRLTVQGLTGVAFLETNFLDPRQNPILPINWTPKNLYFASAPSTLARVESILESITGLTQQIEAVNFKKFAQTLDAFISTLDRSLVEADVKTFTELLAKNLNSLFAVLNKINDFLDKPGSQNLVADVAAAAASAKQTLGAISDDLPAAVRQIRAITGDLKNAAGTINEFLGNKRLKESADVLPETLDNVKQASRDIRVGAVELQRLLRRLSELAESQSPEIKAVIDEAREAVTNVNQITEDAKRHPSRLFFSDEPAKAKPQRTGGPKSEQKPEAKREPKPEPKP